MMWIWSMRDSSSSITGPDSSTRTCWIRDNAFSSGVAVSEARSVRSIVSGIADRRLLKNILRVGEFTRAIKSAFFPIISLIGSQVLLRVASCPGDSITYSFLIDRGVASPAMVFVVSSVRESSRTKPGFCLSGAHPSLWTLKQDREQLPLAYALGYHILVSKTLRTLVLSLRNLRVCPVDRNLTGRQFFRLLERRINEEEILVIYLCQWGICLLLDWTQ